MRTISSATRPAINTDRMLVDRMSRTRKPDTPLSLSQNSSDARTVMFGSAARGLDLLRPERTAMCISTRRRLDRRTAAAAPQRVDVGATAACILCVRRTLERIQLDRLAVIRAVTLQINAAAGLEPSADDSGHLLHPRAQMGLDRGGFLVGQHPFDPVEERGDATRCVDHWIPSCEISSREPCEVQLEGLGNEVVKGAHDVLRVSLVDGEGLLQIANEARAIRSGQRGRPGLPRRTHPPAARFFDSRGASSALRAQGLTSPGSRGRALSSR